MLITLLYSLTLYLLLPVLFIRLWFRGRQQPEYRKHWAQRLGYYPAQFGQGPRLFWVHAVSLGETRAVAPLIEALRHRFPGSHLLLTHMTATGQLEGRKLLQPGDVQVWLPFDTPGAVARFLQRFHPLFGVLVETELWPNLVHGCEQNNIPLFLVNARVSARSFARMRNWSLVSHSVIRKLTGIAAQTESDAQRLVQLSGRRVAVFGNLKFDVSPSQDLIEQGQTWRARQNRPVLGLLSSREGEEALWCKAWLALPAEQRSKILPLIVPRHPERFDEVARWLEQQGLRVARRSQLPNPTRIDADVWLGDSIGEMHLLAASCELALIGGGWLPLGGQNLIEVCACGCPVIVGPHMFNFAQATKDALQGGAAIQSDTLEQALQIAATILLERPQQKQALRTAAQHFAHAHRGAAVKTAQWVIEQL